MMIVHKERLLLISTNINLNSDHIIKTGYNYGAFYNNQLVSSIVSFDLTNIGSP